MSFDIFTMYDIVRQQLIPATKKQQMEPQVLLLAKNGLSPAIVA